MPVNPDIGHRRARRTQAERSAVTRSALLAAGRRLFAERGYAATGREDIVRAAGVTRGALYHHFAGKQELFRALYEELERETMAHVVAVAAPVSPPREQLRAGAQAYLDAALEPAVQRVVLLDGPAVLGWDACREIARTYALGLVREVLVALIDAGVAAPQPVEPLAHLLLGLLHEAALYVARADDPASARREMGDAVDRWLERL